MAFESPVYVLRNGKYRVDVTLSAPPQTKRPISVLDDFLAFLKEREKTGIQTVCDFGAGKLRNTLHMLKKGFKVYSVEFKDQYENYEKSKAMLDSIKNKYSKTFKKLIFPTEFLRENVRFDVVLLVYVAHIIPRPRDRQLVIEYCARKLRRKGYIFWVSPQFDTNMRRICNVSFGDGWILNETRERQTFYTEFKVKQIDTMLEAQGLTFLQRLEFGKNLARVYVKD